MHLSPLTRRRLAIFRAHRRGYWSLWIFLALFGLTLFAEFLANDRPLLIRYDGHWYVPVLQDYSEDTFGDELHADRGGLHRSRRAGGDQRPRLDDLAGDPLHLQHGGEAAADAGALAAGLARTCWAPMTRRATCWRA